MELGLEGQKSLVLAASDGLGHAVASELVAEGSNVIVTSSDIGNLEDAVAEIRDGTDATSGPIDFRRCDLDDPESIEEGVEGAIDDLGGLDVLVTNHGGPLSKPFSDLSIDDVDATYRSVLRSTVQTCQLALPTLRDGGGSITNLVAASTLEPNVSGAAANIVRPGIYGLSKTLANEFGDDGVRVNCVAPRGVYTDRIGYKIDLLAETEGISIEEATERREEELPLARLGSPEEFARAVTFLASPAAGFVTGAVLRVDGGWSDHAF